MKYATHNTTDIPFTGTWLQGYIEAPFFVIKSFFGQPHEGDQYKVDAEWDIKFQDGTVATIYNWKNGKSYNGPTGDAVEDMCVWHIGGNSERAVELVQEVLKHDALVTYAK